MSAGPHLRPALRRIPGVGPMRTRLAEREDRRRAARLAAAARQALTPPPPGAFAHFGRDAVIVPPARVDSPHLVSIGDRTVVHEHTWLSMGRFPEATGVRLSIGDRVRIGRFSMIVCLGSVTIDDDVVTSDTVFIGDAYHGYEDVERPVLEQPIVAGGPVRVRRHAFLGFGAIILPGVTVGAGAHVGEGAVVTSDVPDDAWVMGNPARVVALRGADGWRPAPADA